LKNTQNQNNRLKSLQAQSYKTHHIVTSYSTTDRLEDLDYADDICLLAHTFNDIRTKLQQLHHETAKVGLKINISKTKEIRIHTPNNQPLFLKDQQIEQVSEFPIWAV